MSYTRSLLGQRSQQRPHQMVGTCTHWRDKLRSIYIIQSLHNTCRHITISTSPSEQPNAKKIAVEKGSDVDVRGSSIHKSGNMYTDSPGNGNRLNK